MYIKEQFDLQPYRRDYVSSEYKLQKNPYYSNIDYGNKDKLSNDTNVKDQDNNSDISDEISNEIDIIIALKSDGEIELVVDTSLNASQKQAAYYEQECYK